MGYLSMLQQAVGICPHGTCYGLEEAQAMALLCLSCSLPSFPDLALYHEFHEGRTVPVLWVSSRALLGYGFSLAGGQVQLFIAQEAPELCNSYHLW